MGLYDLLRQEFSQIHGSASMPLVMDLKAAKIVRASNVQRYYSEEVTDVEDFRRQLGALMPPFPLTWIEVEAPKRHRIESAIMKWPPFGFQRAGVLLRPVEMHGRDQENEYWRIAYDMFYQFPENYMEVPKGKPGEYFHYPTVNGYFSLDADGYGTEEKVASYKPAYEMSPLLEEVLQWCHSIFSDVMLMSLSFLNCKNVVLEEVTPPAPVLTKKQKRLHIVPRAEHVYSNIIIQPLKALTAKNNAIPKPGEPSYHMRLHITRGHFRTYLPEKPLFGKPGWHGKFWIPSHLSGRETEGTVDSTYEIRIPESVPAPRS